MHDSWDMVCNGHAGGQADGQKKWHIEVGTPPKYTDQIIYLVTDSDDTDTEDNLESNVLSNLETADKD